MHCPRCIEALNTAGNVLRELTTCDPHLLPPDKDWAALGVDLLKLAGSLRLHNRYEGANSYGRSAKEAE